MAAMPANQFSEFTFGFAFTQEVTSLCWDALSSAPEMPSLIDEGKGKGFDVSLGLWGWTLFAQFKRGFLATRSTAKQWSSYGASYFRFEIYPANRSSQHDDLLALEKASVAHWVAYVAPVFHESRSLNRYFLERQILDNVRMIAPSALGPADDDLHYVTYQNRLDVPLLHSEPRAVEALNVRELRNRISQPSWTEGELLATGQPLGPQPILLNESYFAEASTRMMSIAEASKFSRDLSALFDVTQDMSAFGRARTLGRLLFGGELVVLVASGQTVA